MKKIYVIILLFLYLILLSTFNPNQSDDLESKKSYFFRIKNIEIINSKLTNKEEIKKKLSYIVGKNIFNLKKLEIKSLIYPNDFLEKIEVKKKYPDTIIVKIYETTPLAIFFKDDKKYFLDNSSKLIPFNNKIESSNLPNLFGKNAENKFIFFFDEIKKSNFLKSKIENYFYHQIGRWDIELFDGKIIKYPADKVAEAIAKSINLLNREDFANYNVIDLRVSGGVIVE